jgi:TetR/AcrR family transcriptional repressor of lmrAB and yxaGH operons
MAPNDTRNRMLAAAVVALRRHGVAGMSFSEILDSSGAARGAIYHHFPGGKAQLVAEAAALDGRAVLARFEQLPATDPVQLVGDFLALVRPVVIESSHGCGCAVAAVALGLEGAADAAFGSWVGALTDRLTAAGLAPDDAGDLATTLITLLEGAHVLCRAAASIEPFDRMARAATALVAARYQAR